MADLPTRENSRTRLARRISLPLLTLYGLGTMVGGGFYALVGKVAGEAGAHAPVAVLLAALLGLVNALTYGELASRYPFSAGEARYVEQAFGRAGPSVLVGWLVMATGMVSAATLANAIFVFLQEYVDWPRLLVITAIVAAFGLTAAWGIAESVMAAIAITFVEVAGLVYVIGATSGSYAELPARLPELLPGFSAAAWSGVGLGAFLIFYAFIGFEDMVNLAEEVKCPRRNLPLGILLALAGTSLLYLLVTLALVLSLPTDVLAEARAPLARLVADRGAGVVLAMTAIGTLAGVNGALVQVIMASRVAYGMSDRGMGPAWLGVVSRRTRTPLNATAVVTLLVLALALWFPLVPLAKLTSAGILVVFALVNLSLWRIQGADRKGGEVGEGLRLPRWLPLAGMVFCLAILLHQLVAIAATRDLGWP